MKPGNRETIPTISEVVREAAAIVDPDGSDDAITAFFESFEDDDRPTTATEDLWGVLLSTARGIDPEGDDPAALAAAAAAFWLSTNPGQADNGDHVLREGIRLAFEGNPPEPLSEWLGARGIDA
ncbi:MAG TPA: hypothetical protein VNN15_06640 [Solirubrobacterales bacterium]|nr:hypothetical protein [Solirubrobacterales bacterium]